jgi:hypothetical protein
MGPSIGRPTYAKRQGPGVSKLLSALHPGRIGGITLYLFPYHIAVFIASN